MVQLAANEFQVFSMWWTPERKPVITAKGYVSGEHQFEATREAWLHLARVAKRMAGDAEKGEVAK